MDALNSIAIGMAAIAFTWVGYFLGNFFPVFGKAKQRQLERKAAGEKLVNLKGLGSQLSQSAKSINLTPLKRAWTKSIDWLLERETEEELEAEEPADQPSISPMDEQIDTDQPPRLTETPAAAERQQVLLPPAVSIADDAVLLWHDRQNKKLFARVGKKVVDLDGDLSKQQHGTLSMLLVDLQDKVGLSAALKAAISEGTDQAYAEKEKQIRQASVPKEAPLNPPSFNPVKTFINYVKADVPKLEDKPESIPSQINSIVQDLIRDTPLEDRGISVADWPSRGVVFIVGIDVYDDIEQIPDSQIRQLIRSAVQQWEESQAEGE